MDKEQYINQTKEVYNKFGFEDLSVSFIIKESNDPNNFRCLLYNKHNQEEIVVVAPEEEPICYKIPDWSFNLDDDLFAYLENGYEIVHIPIEEHCGMWTMIDLHQDDINFPNGLQAYLNYCKQNEITNNELKKFQKNVPNIMHLYKEKNGNYEIIAEMIIGKTSIVLAHNPKAASPYATWEANVDRRYGFVSGVYYDNYDSAFKNFKERSIKEFKYQMGRQETRSRPPKKTKKHEAR